MATLDSAAIDSALDPQALSIGGRIRALRLARGLTLVQLAERAELSHPFLSQLERGRARPSMVSLERIARALGSSQLELIAAAEDVTERTDETPTVLVRAGEGTIGQYAEGLARLLVHGNRNFHPMIFTGDNPEVGDYFVHEEDEFVHVISGSVEIDLADHGVSTLVEGDSLYYVGGVPHRWRALEPGGYRLFVVKEKPQQL